MNIRSLLRFIFALVFTPVVFLFFIPFMWFMDWLFDFPDVSAGQVYQGWLSWILFR